MTTLQTIEDFLGQKRIAFVGVSRRGQDFSRLLFREFVRRGYDVVPVNPLAGQVEGRRAFRLVQEIDPPVDGVMVMTPAQKAEEVVRDCVEAGVQRVWLYRAVGQGAMSPSAVELCESAGLRLVPGYCPFMFWRDTGIFHRLHGLVTKLTGSFPQ